MNGVPYRVVVLNIDRKIISRGETALAHPRSLVGSALAFAPVGAVFHSMGIDYERAALTGPTGRPDTSSHGTRDDLRRLKARSYGADL